MPRPTALVLVGLVALGLTVFFAMTSPRTRLNSGAENTLRLAIRQPAGPLDPATQTSIEATMILYPVYQGLVASTVDPATGADMFEPELAEHWDVSDDGLTWTFFLGPRHLFSDGTAVTAEAVKWSLERAIQLGRGPASELIDLVQTIEAPEEYTVVIRLNRRVHSLLPTLSQRVAWIINPSAGMRKESDPLGVGWLAEKTEGSGPYTLVRSAHGTGYFLEPNPYWNGPAPQILRIAYLHVPDASIAAMMLKRGDLDLAFTLSTESLAQLESRSDLNVFAVPVAATQALAFNVSAPPFDSIDVRRAANSVISQTEITQTLRAGRANLFDGPIFRGAPGSRPLEAGSCSTYETPPLREKVEIDLIYPGVSPATDTLAIYLQSVLGRAGFDTRLQKLSVPAFFDRIESGRFDAAIMGWVAPNTDPSSTLGYWYDPDKIGVSGNYARYNQGDITALAEAADAAPDAAMRDGLYAEAAQKAREMCLYSFLQHSVMFVAASSRVTGIENTLARDIYDLDFASMALQGTETNR